MSPRALLRRAVRPRRPRGAHACRRRGRWHRSLVAARECARGRNARHRARGGGDADARSAGSEASNGVTIDAGAESYRHQGRTRARPRGGARPGGPHRPPEAGRGMAGRNPRCGWRRSLWAASLGIPANPFQPDVRRIIGWAGVWRAYLDRVRPPLDRAPAQSRKARRVRMGAKVRDRLVAPVTAVSTRRLPTMSTSMSQPRDSMPR